MPSTKKMEELIGWILAIGTLLSALLVLVGGAMYLTQHGLENMQTEFLQAGMTHFTLSLSSIGIIELGLLLLVATQLLRVGLLVWFYASIRDYWFTLISMFILLMLVYSFVWRS